MSACRCHERVMPRRPPARLRAESIYRRPLDGTTSVLPALSPRGLRAIAYLERTRLWDEAVFDAFMTWSWFVRHPQRRFWDLTAGCGIMRCCPDPSQVRWILDVAVAALPARDARRLRARVAALDSLW